MSAAAHATLLLFGSIQGRLPEIPRRPSQIVVLAPPSRMENRGLPREVLKPGKTATVAGYPNRTDANEMRAERITVDGKTTELR